MTGADNARWMEPGEASRGGLALTLVVAICALGYDYFLGLRVITPLLGIAIIVLVLSFARRVDRPLRQLGRVRLVYQSGAIMRDLRRYSPPAVDLIFMRHRLAVNFSVTDRAAHAVIIQLRNLVDVTSLSSSELSTATLQNGLALAYLQNGQIDEGWTTICGVRDGQAFLQNTADVQALVEGNVAAIGMEVGRFPNPGKRDRFRSVRRITDINHGVSAEALRTTLAGDSLHPECIRDFSVAERRYLRNEMGLHLSMCSKHEEAIAAHQLNLDDSARQPAPEELYSRMLNSMGFSLIKAGFASDAWVHYRSIMNSPDAERWVGFERYTLLNNSACAAFFSDEGEMAKELVAILACEIEMLGPFHPDVIVTGENSAHINSAGFDLPTPQLTEPSLGFYRIPPPGRPL